MRLADDALDVLQTLKPTGSDSHDGAIAGTAFPRRANVSSGESPAGAVPTLTSGASVELDFSAGLLFPLCPRRFDAPDRRLDGVFFGARGDSAIWRRLHAASSAPFVWSRCSRLSQGLGAVRRLGRGASGPPAPPPPPGVWSPQSSSRRRGCFPSTAHSRRQVRTSSHVVVGMPRPAQHSLRTEPSGFAGRPDPLHIGVCD